MITKLREIDWQRAKSIWIPEWRDLKQEFGPIFLALMALVLWMIDGFTAYFLGLVVFMLLTGAWFAALNRGTVRRMGEIVEAYEKMTAETTDLIRKQRDALGAAHAVMASPMRPNDPRVN